MTRPATGTLTKITFAFLLLSTLAWGVTANVQLLTATSNGTQVTLNWNNPPTHTGVLILRAIAATPNTPPTPGVGYTVGLNLGNATVVFADTLAGSTKTSFTDTGLMSGLQYYYKVYNFTRTFVYANASVPSAQGIFAFPTDRVSPSPLWCYSVGFPTLQQPVIDPGVAVMTAGNLGAVIANVTSTTSPAADGLEKWRPVQLTAPVQSRYPLAPITGQAGQYIITGDQAGNTYVVNYQTGTILIQGNGNLPIGDVIQAPPAGQINAYTNAAFQAANPNHDLLYFATRNNSTTNNQVVALSSTNALAQWTYAPNDMDIINGAMVVDYPTNHLYVASRSGTLKTQASFRVINTLNGSEIARASLGDIDTGIAKDYSANQVYTVTKSGTAYGFKLNTFPLIPAWSANIGAVSDYLFPTGSGFIASLSGGTLQRYKVQGTTVSAFWATPAAVANPSGLAFDYVSQKLFVGSSDGKIHQFDVITGKADTTLAVTTGAVQIGTPAIDPVARRISVGTADGRVCTYQLPLP